VRRIPADQFLILISAEVDELLLSAPTLTPAGLFDQAIDEIGAIALGDCEPGSGHMTTKRFQMTPDRLLKITQLAARAGISENDVAIAAIRQFARRHSLA
jgi:hypothetical protein